VRALLLVLVAVPALAFDDDFSWRGDPDRPHRHPFYCDMNPACDKHAGERLKPKPPRRRHRVK
jgi:hypothetical protein